jgi:TIR domain
MPLESSAQTDAATDLRNGVSPKSGRRGVRPKPIASVLTRVGLRFDDPAVEDQYRVLFAEYAIYRTRIAMGLAVVTNAVFGIWDLTSASGGLMSTRFRYMVAFPAFAIFFAGSFHRSMKRWWQEYSVLFCVVVTVCMYHSVVLFDMETEFNIARGNGTLNFQLAAIFGALFPIGFLYMVVGQAIFQLAHALLLYYHPPPNFYLTTYFSFLVNSASTVVCLIAYWRETVSRRQFAQLLARGESDQVGAGISYVGDGYLEGSGELVAKRTPQNSPRITISYRREDSGIITGRIFDRLANHYGKAAVFRDIDNIPAGVDFREHIGETLSQSDVVLAIVGPRWIGSHSGRDRLSEPSDPVRVEVEAALQKRKPLVPVLVLNAHMPTVEQLPSSLHDFAYRNAVTIDAEQDFDVHMARLIRSIDRIAKKTATDNPGNSNC